MYIIYFKLMERKRTANNHQEHVQREEEDMSDPIVVQKPFFSIETVDETDLITAVDFNKTYTVIGTNSGQLFLLDKSGNPEPKQKLARHRKKVTQIKLTHDNCVITASADSTLHIHSFNEDFDDLEIKIKGSEITSFDLRGALNPARIELFVGDREGVFCYYEKGWFLENKRPFHKGGEGSVTDIACFQDVVAWASFESIKFIDFKEKKKLGFIPRPKLPEDAPEYVRLGSGRPCMVWKPHSDTKSKFVFSWFYMVKVYVLAAEGAGKSLDCIQQFALEEHSYICGFASIADSFLLCNFDAFENHSAQLTTYSKQFDLLHQEEVLFTQKQSLFQAIHFQMIPRHGTNMGEAVLFNPHQVVRIQPVTVQDRITFLLPRKRFEECLQLVKDHSRSLPEETVTKVQNGHLDHLLSQRNYFEASELLKEYLGRDDKRWEHWINRFKQKKALRHIVHIIPRERPKLHASVYRGICDSFVSLSDCEGLAKAVRRFPPQLLDYDAFLRDVKAKMQKDPELQKNEDFIEALYHMFSYTSDKEGAFLTLLKLKNQKIFDVVRAGKIEVDMQRNIRELLDICPKKTI